MWRRGEQAGGGEPQRRPLYTRQEWEAGVRLDMEATQGRWETLVRRAVHEAFPNSFVFVQRREEGDGQLHLSTDVEFDGREQDHIEDQARAQAIIERVWREEEWWVLKEPENK